MAKTDTYHTTNSVKTFAILEMNGTQELFGSAVDTLRTESVQLIGHVDQLSSGTYTVEFQESDDSAFTVPIDVDTNFVFGSPMTFTSADANGTAHVGYVGNKRYIRAKVNAVGVVAGASIGVTVLLGYAHHNPIEGSDSPTG